MIILRLIRLLWLGWRFRRVDGERVLSKDYHRGTGTLTINTNSINSAEDFQELHG